MVVWTLDKGRINTIISISLIRDKHNIIQGNSRDSRSSGENKNYPVLHLVIRFTSDITVDRLARIVPVRSIPHGGLFVFVLLSSRQFQTLMSVGMHQLTLC